MKKYKKLEKQKILQGIRICTQMENHWYNGMSPNSNYKDYVAEIRTLLEQLLTVDVHVRRENEKDK